MKVGRKTRFTLLLVFFGLLAVSFAPLIAGEDTVQAPPSSHTSPSPGSTPSSTPSSSPGSSPASSPVSAAPHKRVQHRESSYLIDQAVVDDVQSAREKIETKQKELNEKEAELKARESAVADELRKLGEIRNSISQVQAGKKKEKEEKVTRLVEMFLTMSPKSAAKVLSSLDEDLAVETMSQMDTQRLAKIVNVMEPGRSSRLSERMAGVTHPRSPARARETSLSQDDRGTKSLSEKGGNQSHGQREQSNGAADDIKQSEQAKPNASPQKAAKLN